LLILGIVVLHYYQENKEVQFNKGHHIAQDYSIVITNPPKDAIDPGGWKNVFESNCRRVHVTLCTVSVGNDLVVKSLARRRELMRQTDVMLPPDESLGMLNISKFAAKIEKKRHFWDTLYAKIVPGIPELFGQVVVLTSKVKGLAQWSRPANNIFITFETESTQQRILKHLSFGMIHVMGNNTSKISNPNHLFRGEKLSNAREANEPSTIRWTDLNQRRQNIWYTKLQTTIVSVGVIALIAMFTAFCK